MVETKMKMSLVNISTFWDSQKSQRKKITTDRYHKVIILHNI